MITARHGASAMCVDDGDIPYIYVIGGYTINQDERFVDISFDI